MIINKVFLLVCDSFEAGQLLLSLLELRLFAVQVVSDVLQFLQAGQDRCGLGASTLNEENVIARGCTLRLKV